jgi:iron complex transport system ATP-binding protein
MREYALSARSLTIGYPARRSAAGGFVVARELSVGLPKGEVVCLVGPNGAGKSTLLRTLAGLQHPLDGTVLLGEELLAGLDARERARRIGVVLTERVNVGVLPAVDLVALGRHPHTDWAGRLSRRDMEVVDRTLREVGAWELRERNVNELSDGERQKIMIARALAQEPAVVILDEPTAFLDLPRRVEVMGLLHRLARGTGRAILLSTHDLDLAIRAADQMWLMSSEGRLSVGAPEDLVLGGELERVFASEGLEFDRLHGSFHLASVARTQVALDGEGLSRAWTRRALERGGYRVASAPAEPEIRVRVIEDGAGWELSAPEGMSSFGSIYDLMSALSDRR